MSDPYFYIDAPVFRNKLGVRDKTTLKRIEAELSRANMMLLYEKGFENFSPAGLCEIHFALFGDLYDWAGQYRHISLEKPEQRLCGRSVWYSRENDISEDLKVAFSRLLCVPWAELNQEQFVYEMAPTFPPIWQVHPFREGNTQSILMMMMFFAEHYGYSVDQTLLVSNAGSIRDALVMASLDQFSECEHLEQLLLDIVRSTLIEGSGKSLSHAPDLPEKRNGHLKDKTMFTHDNKNERSKAPNPV